MKQIFTIFCLALCLLLAQQDVFAQPTQGLTFRYLLHNYLNPEPDWKDWQDIFDNDGEGIEIAYNHRLDNHIWLVVPLKAGRARYPATTETGLQKNRPIVNLDAHLQYNLFKYKRCINPYLLLGVGTTWNPDDNDFDFNMPAGLGLNVRIAKDVFLNAQTQYRFSIEDRPGWQHGIGATLYFGEQDRDGDGIIDKEDKCPDVPGLAALMGCPDRDSDGITDLEDKCPDVPGLATLMGCPDRDGDGITDADDKCPDVAGVAALMGCPDRDSDGITDADDKCPDVAGIPAFQGCPDTDGDGITDANDRCPREAGPASNQGCPIRDRDSDGIPDADDACPDQRGLPSLKGCPDRDGDGLADKDDSCPDKAGPISNKGCPEIKPADKAKLERAVKLVQFQTGKATFLKKSYAVLDEVVSVMNQYPDYSLNISGHTDSSGDDKMNQSLSERRAKACYDYLASKGINASKMSHAGYGETKPVADNKTAAGREQNRRVEFELYVK